VAEEENLEEENLEGESLEGESLENKVKLISKISQYYIIIYIHEDILMYINIIT